MVINTKVQAKQTSVPAARSAAKTYGFPRPSLAWLRPGAQPIAPSYDSADLRLRELRQALYAAASGAGTWLDFGRLLAKVLGANGAQVASYNFEKRHAEFHVLVALDLQLDSVASWEDSAHEDGNATTMAAFPGHVLRTNQDIVPTCIDQMRPPHLQSVMALAWPEDPMWGVLAVFRGEDDQDFTLEEARLMAGLSFDFRRAIEISRFGSRNAVNNRAINQFVSAITRPVGIASGTGAIRRLNHPALKLLQSAGLSQDRLEAEDVGRACVGAVRHGEAGITLEGGISLRLVALAQRNDPSGAFNHEYANEHVLLELRARDSETSTSLRQAAWGLTRAEVEVLDLLAAGDTPAAIALARRTSPNTVKNQIKAIKAKVGVADLTGLLALSKR
jgi:DNA-binding CsgD family transcriptional regulator